jgi:hypothetical protein
MEVKGMEVYRFDNHFAFSCSKVGESSQITKARKR